MSKILLIDADSIAYKKADKVLVGARPSQGFQVEEDGEVVGTEPCEIYTEIHYDAEADVDYEVECDLDIAREEVQAFIDELCEIAGTDKYILLLTAGERTRNLFEHANAVIPHIIHEEFGIDLPEGHSLTKNFRYKVSEDLQHGYKHNRIQKPLHGYESIMYTMITQFNHMIFDYIEADDAIVAMHMADPDWTIVAAMDKDVLNQVPGTHIDYHKLGKTEDEYLYFTGVEKALYYKYYQAIVGDPSDGYKGVPGVGPKRVGKFINEEMSERDLYLNTVKAFESKGMGEKEALATLRLASMHQVHYEDGQFLVELENKERILL